jgi:hypothetical protein
MPVGPGLTRYRDCNNKDLIVMKSSAIARKQGVTLVLDGHFLAAEDVVRAARNRE